MSHGKGISQSVNVFIIRECKFLYYLQYLRETKTAVEAIQMHNKALTAYPIYDSLYRRMYKVLPKRTNVLTEGNMTCINEFKLCCQFCLYQIPSRLFDQTHLLSGFETKRHILKF